MFNRKIGVSGTLDTIKVHVIACDALVRLCNNGVIVILRAFHAASHLGWGPQQS